MSEAEALPGLALAFVLVMCRVGAAVMLLPGLGETEAPAVVRAGLAVALTVLLLPGVAPLLPPSSGVADGAAMAAAEVLAGCVLGWLARLPVLALSAMGAFASTFMGLSSVVQPDPALGGQSSALARGMGLLAPVAVLATGLYALPLAALAGSYKVMRPGAAVSLGGLAELSTQGVSAAFALALRLSAPFVLAGVLLPVGLGLLARLVPQLQVFTVATPGQIVGGLVLLGWVLGPLLQAWMDAVGAGWLLLPGS